MNIIDRWLNTFEDEDGDGVPDWVEALGITGVGIGMVMLGFAALALAAGSFAVGMTIALGVVIVVTGGVVALAQHF